jgi:hypothetical protein
MAQTKPVAEKTQADSKSRGGREWSEPKSTGDMAGLAIVDARSQEPHMPSAHAAIRSGGKAPFLQHAAEAENVAQHDWGVEPVRNQNCLVTWILVQGTYDQVFQLAIGVLCIHTFGGVSKNKMGAARTALNGNIQAKNRSRGK